MNAAIKMGRSSTIVLLTTIRKRFNNASRFDLTRGVVLVLLALAIFIFWYVFSSLTISRFKNDNKRNTLRTLVSCRFWSIMALDSESGS